MHIKKFGSIKKNTYVHNLVNPGKKFRHYFCAFSHLKRIQWEDWQPTCVGSSIPQMCVEFTFFLIRCKTFRNVYIFDLLCVFYMMVHAMVFTLDNNSEHVAHVWSKTD